MAKIPKLPDIPEEQRTPLVAQLLEVIHYQMEVIQSLRDEIAVLKGNKDPSFPYVAILLMIYCHI